LRSYTASLIVIPDRLITLVIGGRISATPIGEQRDKSKLRAGLMRFLSEKQVELTATHISKFYQAS
jgi:hypothetical protein